MDALIEALVVGETYLFRELGALEMMVAEIIVPRLLSGRRPRIWCAACASGEEPHTIAMLLAARGILDAGRPHRQRYQRCRARTGSVGPILAAGATARAAGVCLGTARGR